MGKNVEKPPFKRSISPLAPELIALKLVPANCLQRRGKGCLGGLNPLIYK